MGRRWPGLLGLLLLTGAAIAACGGSENAGPAAATAPAGWTAEAVALDPQAPLAPILVNTSLGVGETRLAFALLNRDSVPVADATASARLFRLATDPGSSRVTGVEAAGDYALTRRRITPGVDHVHPDGAVHVHTADPIAVYTARVNLDRGGGWGAEIRITSADGDTRAQRITFFVQERSDEPSVGEAAPRTEQIVLRDQPDIRLLDTSEPPNPALHTQTVAEAIDSGKPVVVVFATPRFCQTQFCGPVLEEAVLPMVARFGDALVVVHIEPYDIPTVEREGRLVPAPALAEWGLHTEPWVFVLAPGGTVAAKFEGIVEAEEVAAALEPYAG